MASVKKHCLLVVDDEPDLVQSVKDLLRFDYQVLIATRAAEGLQIMQREKVHIVMSDQRMPEMTGVEFLRFVAALYGQEGDAVERRVAELLDVFELTSWKDELVEAYSHGMRQKLIISSALIHRPQCIVVDEPMVGLDPKAARLLKDIFRQFVERGGTVLMSTHTLEVAEAMCDRVAILQHGKIVAEGTVDDLRQHHRAGDASLEELFLKLTGGAQVRDLVEVLGGGNDEGGRAA